MPVKENILRVFVSSPSDVKSERLAVDEIIEEINNAWATFLGIRLEAIRWETHCRPGIGSDSQQVINEQLPLNYDIYLGVLWKHFGTPTPRFESGTEEEFQNAYERHKKEPKAVSVMFYFKNEPVPPTEIDPIQLGKLNDFQKKLGPKGILYWGFESTGEFRHLIRLHLSHELQKWTDKLAPKDKNLSQRHRGAKQIDLELLKSRSKEQAAKILMLLEQAMNSLDQYDQRLSQVLNLPAVAMFDAIANATETYSHLVSNVANGFVETIDEAVEAWVDLFMAELLSKGSIEGMSKKLLNNAKDLAGVFTKQAKRYRHYMNMPVELAKHRQIQASERMMQKAHSIFADELESAAKILREAIRVTGKLSSKRGKLKA